MQDPARDLLAFSVALVEVVIAGAEDDLGPSGEQREVLLHDHDLGAKIHHRADVQRIAGKDYQIELRRRADQPVELRQRVMQVGDDQAAHRKSVREKLKMCWNSKMP